MELLGVPFDLCGYRPGARLGPAAMRLAGLQEAMAAIGHEVIDQGDIQVLGPDHEPGLRNFNAAHHAYAQIFARVSSALRSQRVPIVIGGDHSLSIGSVGAAVNHFEGDVALLWIDAHADLNSPGTSPSGNLHGMPLACLMHSPSEVEGPADAQWKQLQRDFAPHRLQPERVGWIGLRDVDYGERKRLATMGHDYVSTMYDIDRHGLVSEIARFDAWLRQSGARHLWISFDVDSLDPFLAPGTGTAVRGGLTYREMHLLGEMLCELRDANDCPYKLVGLDVVETNPLFDSNNATAKTGVEWICSVFGKTILGSR